MIELTSAFREERGATGGEAARVWGEPDRDPTRRPRVAALAAAVHGLRLHVLASALVVSLLAFFFCECFAFELQASLVSKHCDLAAAIDSVAILGRYDEEEEEEENESKEFIV